MATSELFMDVFCNEHSSGIDCQFCGRTHFTHEDEDVERLRAKAIAEPAKFIEDRENDSIGWGYLDGRQYVWRCPCDSGAKYQDFINRHALRIVEYLKAKNDRERERATEMGQRIAEVR